MVHCKQSEREPAAKEVLHHSSFTAIIAEMHYPEKKSLSRRAEAYGTRQSL